MKYFLYAILIFNILWSIVLGFVEIAQGVFAFFTFCGWVCALIWFHLTQRSK